jgi:uncharacterized metal-binding protein YceD (DUF177 family)
MAEFSRSLPIGLVGPKGRHMVLEADSAECAALAARFGIPAIGSLRAELDLTPQSDGAVVARGRLQADVTQECVVTLEPVAQVVDEAVALRLLPPGQEPADGPEDMDEIAAGPGGVVDLGEALAEQLALALDPYPRAPEAELPPEADQPAASPFAALAGLRRNGR